MFYHNILLFFTLALLSFGDNNIELDNNNQLDKPIQPLVPSNRQTEKQSALTYFNELLQKFKQSTVDQLFSPKVSSAITSNQDWTKLIIATAITFTLLTYTTHSLINNNKNTKDLKDLDNKNLVIRGMNALSGKFSSALSRSSSMLSFNHNLSSSSSSNGVDPQARAKYKLMIAKGGFIGGLSNDGNTCFMNSVLQSLASSNELMEFLESYVSDNNTNNKKRDVTFSNALYDLLDKLNGKHGNKTPTFKTRNLLKVMKDGPNKHLFMGYNQEDAQEFYQSVMKQVEKEFTTKNSPLMSRSSSIQEKQQKKKESKIQDKFVPINEHMLIGLNELGELGDIFIPAVQIDPSYPNAEHLMYPLKLVTPVDGLQCERIGCVKCGEMGGIRYSVISGLGLNLPSLTQSSYTLIELLDDFNQEEIIDEVECNRCGLTQVKTYLLETIATYEKNNKDGKKDKLILLTNKRLQEVENELAKPIIHDDVYERLHTKNKISKSRKTKQAFYARPPALLSIHINRSVFDPKTYMVRKNNARISFPMKLNLTDYVAEPSDINTDARLPFRKQDELKLRQLQEQQKLEDEEAQESLNAEQDVEVNGAIREREDPSSTVQTLTSTATDSDSLYSAEPSVSSQTSPQISTPTQQAQQQPSIQPVIQTNDKLTYSLKSMISHFGTHNYGHYIAYRKFRNTWWRVSDETVRVSSEDEVLNSQGTFMLFYELSDRNDAKDEGIFTVEGLEMDDDLSSSISSSDSDEDDANGQLTNGDSKKDQEVANGQLKKEGSSVEVYQKREEELEESRKQEQLISLQANL